MAQRPRVLVLEHDPTNPPLLLGDWIAEAGADIDVVRLYAGDDVPGDPTAWGGVISLGGSFGARDDDLAPWLPATRTLLAAAVHSGVPTLGIRLGAQLLAVATGGRVERGASGPEIGAYLGAKRDVAEQDLLFGEVPISPDVMQFHHDVISALPAGGVLMVSSPTYPIQAFRVGSAAWGLQFHIETSAADLRRWRGTEPGSGRVLAPEDFDRSERRCGALLDEAEYMMSVVWRAFTHRYVDAVRDGVPQTPMGWAGPRLPVVGTSGAS